MTDKEPDIYQDVVLQIRDAIREDLFDGELGFNEERQKKVAEILKRNFNKSDEQIGKILMEDTNVFNPSTGKIIDTPFFLAPSAVVYGFRPITSKVFPNYNINNDYMGYTDGGIFHKKASRIMRLLTKDNLLTYGVYIILLLILLKVS